jgi:hypothetical protein
VEDDIKLTWKTTSDITAVKEHHWVVIWDKDCLGRNWTRSWWTIIFHIWTYSIFLSDLIMMEDDDY